MSVLISVTGLCKRFRRRHRSRPSTLKETLVKRIFHPSSTEEFLALNEIDLEVRSGEIVGIIGTNGAGKSTLLRLIGGVGLPDSGRITVHGRIGALLELGAGFHPELTGRENVFINGVISGLSRADVAARFDDIVAFSELADSIDNPLRTYSSGMQLRLAFSVSVHTDPDILLIDEVLAVGDLAFQKKCLERIEYFRQRGCAILIVSHDIGQIKNVCDRAIWLRNGSIAVSGSAGNVAEHYEQAMIQETERRRSAANVAKREDSRRGRQGTGEIEITDVQILNGDGDPVNQIERTDSLSVTVRCESTKGVRTPIFSLSISDQDGRILLDTNTSELTMPDLERTATVCVYIDRVDLAGGDYFLDLGVYEEDWACVYDYHWHMYPLRVVEDAAQRGPRQQVRWEFLSTAPHRIRVESSKNE